MSPDPIEIVRGGEELLDAPRPLWLALRDHHHQVDPGIGTPRSDHDSWTRRRAQYAGWLTEDDRAFFLIARRDGHVLAYAFVRPARSTSSGFEIDHETLDRRQRGRDPLLRARGLHAPVRLSQGQPT